MTVWALARGRAVAGLSLRSVRFLAMAQDNRNRLIDVIVYFAKYTQYCGKITLFKLLYLLDFEHFRQTGKSVTGYDYQAWKFGPVPVDLMEEWEEPGGDLLRTRPRCSGTCDRLRLTGREGQ